ncbi:MAG: PTS sugar transporter subunit IIA [Candidatus Omnitrophota bacterium]
MDIMDFLNEKAISADLKSSTKKEIIEELINLLVKTGEIKDKAQIVKILLERESLGSTGIGQGIAIPHGKSDKVKKLVAAFGISKEGVDFESLDGEPVYIFFLLIAPLDSAGPHLKALARISKLLRDRFFRETLRNAESEKELIEIIKREDTRR